MNKELEKAQVQDICGLASKHFVTFHMSQLERLEITL